MISFMLVFFSMSISASVLALILFAIKPLVKKRLSQTWQYYIWLIVVLRFLLPFTPEFNLIGGISNQIQNISASLFESEQHEIFDADEKNIAPFHTDTFQSPTKNIETNTHQKMAFWNKILNQFINNLWIIWLGAALVLFVLKVKSYHKFIRFVKEGAQSGTNQHLLNIYENELEIAKIKRALPLYINEQIISPMLIGFIRPAIVLPMLNIKEDELRQIFRHELTHYKRFDAIYKWLIQIILCIHWYNPLVYLISREINRCCELSCDESVIKDLDVNSRIVYGDALIAALNSQGSRGEFIISLTMGESANLIKERLDMMMHYKKKSKKIICITTILTVILICGFTFTGAYAVERSKAVNLQPDNAIISHSGGTKMADIEIGGSINGEQIYMVYTEKGLRSIGTKEYGMDKFYMLASDIELSDQEWVPIGTVDNPFTGEFDGNGFDIKGLTMKSQERDIAGLFGYAEGATIHNVTLTDLDIPSLGSDSSLDNTNIACAVCRKACDITDIFVTRKAKSQSTQDNIMETTTIKGTTWYLVNTEAQLRAIGTGNYSLDKNYMQNADIDVSSAEWIPIGTKDRPFTGTFNGNGFKIMNLTITDPDLQIIGMFGVADNAAICNITLKDYDILRAGRNTGVKSIAPVLAFGNGSTKSYGHHVYAKADEQ